MALTLSEVRQTVVGNLKMKIYDITFDSSYPTNGEGFTPSDVGMRDFESVCFSGDSSGYVPQFDYTNEKIKMYEAGADGAALDEVANGTDLSSVSCRVIIHGK